MGCCGVCQAHAYVKNERNTLIDVIVRKAHSICAIKKARCENVILAKVTNVMWCTITPKWSKRHYAVNQFVHSHVCVCSVHITCACAIRLTTTTK